MFVNFFHGQIGYNSKYKQMPAGNTAKTAREELVQQNVKKLFSPKIVSPK